VFTLEPVEAGRYSRYLLHIYCDLPRAICLTLHDHKVFALVDHCLPALWRNVHIDDTSLVCQVPVAAHLHTFEAYPAQTKRPPGLKELSNGSLTNDYLGIGVQEFSILGIEFNRRRYISPPESCIT
jgi:hypothetical protein